MDSVRFTSDVSDEEMIRRLADMNSFISLPFNDNVKNYIILYSEKMKERMGRILGLSQYYFPVFEDILSKYSLPLELKYMAIVESMLNPTATSRAGAKGIWQFMYAKEGPINALLHAIGVENPPVWLSNQKTALLAVMIMIIWKGIGYYMIVYLAGLKGIPADQYEAAELDGANAWNKLIHVTIPNLRPVTFYATIMCIINSFQVFTPIYVMTGGGPGRATSVMVLQIYEDSFVNYEFGYASSEAMILFLLILIVTLIQFYHNKRVSA